MKFSQGHWTFFGPRSEEKLYGKSSYSLKGEWDPLANKMVQRFQGTGHPVFKSISALSRGILKKKNGRETIHFNGDSTNTELLFQKIHSVNKVSIYGAVAKWCQQFGLTEEEKGRVNLSVDKKILTSVPTKASGNSVRENILNFEALSCRIHFSQQCGKTHFQHRVSDGMKYKTRPDKDDGTGSIVPLNREYTFSRAHLQSRVCGAIPGGTIIGPVIVV